SPEGGEVTPETSTVTYGLSYTLPLPVRAGYAFGGWYSGPGGTGAQLTDAAGASLAPWAGDTDTTVYAAWMANTYTVTYSTADGCTVSAPSKTVTCGASYTLDVPTRGGDLFYGWYALVNGTDIRLTDGAGAGLEPWAIAADVAVTAGWAELMTFDFNGVTVNGNASVTQAVLTAADIPWPVKAQTGKVFLGWYDAAAGGTQQSAADILAAGHAETFYAHWYTVVGPWAYDSATGGMVADYAYTGAAVAWTPAAADGTIAYTFEAWGGNGGQATYGGIGGYSKGNLTVAAGTSVTLYLYTGQAGQYRATGHGAGGWNGGGLGGNARPSWGGGGASSISLANGAWNNTTVLDRRILVAGGGGGGVYGQGTYENNTAWFYDYGGNGGGLSGGAAYTTGATQTQPGGYPDTYVGSWGVGGEGGPWNNDTCIAGGGGGGYYGGAGGYGIRRAGSGGSGYVFGLEGCGDTTHHPALLASFPQYQFSNGVTKRSGETGYVAKPTAAGNNGYIRVSYIPPAAVQ
ncbi:MAG: InlB B-repeat-containing protein, partial [Spirochaetaceae bacterium]|nr:InlB B-repeat-containing protein [Spirochaetaceae bacterium]